MQWNKYISDLESNKNQFIQIWSRNWMCSRKVLIFCIENNGNVSVVWFEYCPCKQKHQQVCIPVGCVPPACWLFPVVSRGVSGSSKGGCPEGIYVSRMGCVQGAGVSLHAMGQTSPLWTESQGGVQGCVGGVSRGHLCVQGAGVSLHAMGQTSPPLNRISGGCSGVCRGGVQRAFMCPGGWCIPACNGTDTPHLWTESQTGEKSIILPQTSFAGGNNSRESSEISDHHKLIFLSPCNVSRLPLVFNLSLWFHYFWTTWKHTIYC